MTSLELLPLPDEVDLYQRSIELEYVAGEPVAIVVRVPADLAPPVRIPVSPFITSQDVAWALAAQVNDVHQVREAVRRRINRRVR